MGGNQNVPMPEHFNFESSFPLSLVILLIYLTRLCRPFVCAISAWILTRKADSETRIKALEVLCADRRYQLKLGQKSSEREQ